MRALTVVAAALLAAACAGPGSKQGMRYYVLEAPARPPLPAARKVDTTLLVAPTTSAPQPTTLTP